MVSRPTSDHMPLWLRAIIAASSLLLGAFAWVPIINHVSGPVGWPTVLTSRRRVSPRCGTVGHSVLGQSRATSLIRDCCGSPPRCATAAADRSVFPATTS
jgi:hypothetical protein